MLKKKTPIPTIDPLVRYKSSHKLLVHHIPVEPAECLNRTALLPTTRQMLEKLQHARSFVDACLHVGLAGVDELRRHSSAGANDALDEGRFEKNPPSEEMIVDLRCGFFVEVELVQDAG